jgi:hypothetical protein
MTTIEQWLAVVGYEGSYEVSNFGRVRSYKRGRRLILRERPRNGYLAVVLYTRGVPKTESINILVLQAFVGPKPDGEECLHLDDCKIHNHLDNLKWGTHAENIAMRNHAKGEKQGSSKLTKASILEIRAMRPTHTLQSIADKFSIHNTTVSGIVRGKAWAHVKGESF